MLSSKKPLIDFKTNFVRSANYFNNNKVLLYLYVTNEMLEYSKEYNTMLYQLNMCPVRTNFFAP